MTYKTWNIHVKYWESSLYYDLFSTLIWVEDISGYSENFSVSMLVQNKHNKINQGSIRAAKKSSWEKKIVKKSQPLK